MSPSTLRLLPRFLEFLALLLYIRIAARTDHFWSVAAATLAHDSAPRMALTLPTKILQLPRFRIYMTVGRP